MTCRLLISLMLITLTAAGCSDEHGTRGGLPELRPGRTWRVPEDRSTISEALINAQIGDTIVIACGVYEEHGLLIPDGIVMTSETGRPDCVVIDAGGMGRVLTCVMGVNETTEIIGLTLTGGAASFGAGIWFAESSPRITNCLITENLADGAIQGGGGILCYRSSPIFTDCVITDNIATRSGGGIYCERSSPSFTRCTVSGNRSFEGGGIYLSDSSKPRFVESLFEGNLSDPMNGGAVHTSASEPSFIDCLFLENQSLGDGGAVLCREASNSLFEGCTFVANHALGRGGALFLSSSACSLRVSTLVGDMAVAGSALFLEEASFPVIERVIIAFGEGGGAVGCDQDSAVVSCSNIFGNIGGDWQGCLERQDGGRDNISADPLFCDPESRDFRLRPESPCLGDSLGCPNMGAWPMGCDRRRPRAR